MSATQPSELHQRSAMSDENILDLATEIERKRNTYLDTVERGDRDEERMAREELAKVFMNDKGAFVGILRELVSLRALALSAQAMRETLLVDVDAIRSHGERVLARLNKTPHGPKRSRLAEQSVALSDKVKFSEGWNAALQALSTSPDDGAKKNAPICNCVWPPEAEQQPCRCDKYDPTYDAKAEYLRTLPPAPPRSVTTNAAQPDTGRAGGVAMAWQWRHLYKNRGPELTGWHLEKSKLPTDSPYRAYQQFEEQPLYATPPADLRGEVIEECARVIIKLIEEWRDEDGTEPTTALNAALRAIRALHSDAVKVGEEEIERLALHLREKFGTSSAPWTELSGAAQQLWLIDARAVLALLAGKE